MNPPSERLQKARRDVWLADRRKGLGGSDAAGVAGVSPWVTPLDVYYDKIGEGSNEETPDMRRGTILEPAVRQMYCDATGYTVRKPDGILVHPEYPWMLANLDGWVDSGDARIFEGKTSRTRLGWGEPGTAEIPMPYLFQVQHYLAFGFEVADVGVLFGDFEFAVYTVPADPEFQRMLIEVEWDFWQRVIDRRPPDPISNEDVKRRWPVTRFTDAVKAADSDVYAAQVLAAVKSQIKALECVQNRAEAILKLAIADHEALAFGQDTIATWKTVNKADRFDAKRFAEEHPTLHGKYLVSTSPTRQFLLKEKCPCLKVATTNPMLPPIPSNLLPASAPEPA